jgi:hypothetical protein
MKTIKVSKQNGRYYPVIDGTVDLRCKEFRTLREVRFWFRYITGEKVKVQTV